MTNSLIACGHKGKNAQKIGQIYFEENVTEDAQEAAADYQAMDQETDQIYFEDTDTEDNYEKVEALDDKSLIFEELITKFEKKGYTYSWPAYDHDNVLNFGGNQINLQGWYDGYVPNPDGQIYIFNDEKGAIEFINDYKTYESDEEIDNLKPTNDLEIYTYENSVYSESLLARYKNSVIYLQGYADKCLEIIRDLDIGY